MANMPALPEKFVLVVCVVCQASSLVFSVVLLLLGHVLRLLDDGLLECLCKDGCAAGALGDHGSGYGTTKEKRGSEKKNKTK